MYNNISIKLLDFLLSLSEALDLFSPQLVQHQIRTAFIAWKIGEKFQVSPKNLEEIISAALIHDIGALSVEDKVSLHENTYNEDLNYHCIYGERILKLSSLFEETSQIVKFHHTDWSKWDNTDNYELAVNSQIVGFADAIERSINRKEFILHQNEDIVYNLVKTDNDFHPDIIDAFRSVSSNEEFWLDLVSPSIADIIRKNAPNRNKLIFQDDFLSISEMLRNIIDFRSHFTATHSTGVSSAASIISKIMGYSEIDSEMIQIAGNLHDLGKFAVPNSILEKTDKLTLHDFAFIRQHTYHTYSILRRCGLPQNIIEWAAFHHEKLNGQGYPFHLNKNKISIGSRIIASADVLIALIEDRPYRKGMKKESVLTIIKDMADSDHLDLYVTDIIKNKYDDIVDQTREKQQIAEKYYIENSMNDDAGHNAQI